MLNREQKKEIINNLKSKINQSKAVVICDYKGTSVSNFSALREILAENDEAEIKVAKKTLIDRALKETSIDFKTERLEGQVALIFGKQDEVTAPKKIFDFSKKVKSINILAGILGKTPITKKEVEQLAKLPSKKELLAKVAGTINAPLANFVSVLNGNLRKVVYVLNAIKDKKQSS